MMRRAALAALAALVVVLAGCGGDDGPSLASQEGAGAFLKRITEYHVSGEYSRSWEELHPAHRKLISQIQFQYCGKQSEAPERENDTVRVLRTSDARLAVPGVPQRRAKAVRIQIRDAKGRPVDTYTAHAVTVERQWRWVLSRPFLRALERRRCPDGSPLPD